MVGMIEVSPSPAPAASPASHQQVRRRSSAPPKPDRTAMEEAANKKSAEIEALAARIREIKSILEVVRQSRGAVNPELIDAENQVGVLQSDLAIAKDDKERLRAERQANDAERSRLSTAARELRNKLEKNIPLERLDGEIREMEGSGRAKRDIQRLYKQREILVELLAVEEEIKRGRAQRVAENDALKAIGEKLSLTWDALQEQKKKLASLREKKPTGGGDVNALHQERNEAYTKLKALSEERKKIRDQFNDSMDEWYKKRQLHNDRMKKELDRKRVEWEERQAAQKAREAEFFVEEFTDEIIECDQLLAWLNKQGERSPRDGGPVNLNSSVDFPALEGFVALPNKRNNQELESWLVGSKAGKGKSSRAAPPKPERNQKLSLSVDMLNTFSKLKIKAPLSLGDVSGSIRDIQGKREEFVKLQAEAKARRESGVEEKKQNAAADAENGDDDAAADAEYGDDEEASPSCSAGPSEDPSSLDASFDDSEEASTESPLAEGVVLEVEQVVTGEPEVEPVVAAEASSVVEVEPEVEPVVTGEASSVPEAEPEVEPSPVPEVEPVATGEESPVSVVEPEVPEVEPVVTGEASPVDVEVEVAGETSPAALEPVVINVEVTEPAVTEAVTSEVVVTSEAEEPVVTSEVEPVATSPVVVA